MEVILLERVAKLGQMGDVVRVKDGYARNFLLPRGKALRATEDNKTRFDSMKSELETRNLAAKGEAEKVAVKLDGKSFVVLRQASEGGQLYGSVSTRAQCADQDDRLAPGAGWAAPGGQLEDHHQRGAQQRRGRTLGARRGCDGAPRGGRGR